MAATVYMIKTNGVELDETYTNKGRAVGAAEGYVKAADELGMGDVIEIVTQKTGKVVFTYTAANVIAEANKITADKDAHTMRLSEAEALEDVYPETPLVGTVAVINSRFGTASTHYHAPGCRDIQTEMTRWNQTNNDVHEFAFESVADILVFEMGDVSSDRAEVGTSEWWSAVLENSNGVVRIMPCLEIPAGRVGDSPLVTNDNFFRTGFDAPSAERVAEAQAEIDAHSCDDPKCITCLFKEMPEDIEITVTKEYQLEIIVDDISGAAVDLGWYTFTLSVADAHDTDAIANAYGEHNGSGQPRHGWGSIIRVIDICDI